MVFHSIRNKPHILNCPWFEILFLARRSKSYNNGHLACSSGDKDDDDDDDADDKMQSSVLTGGEEGRQGSQEQSEVDHGDFEMVVSIFFFLIVYTSMQVRASDIVFILCLLQSESMVLETAENVNNGNPSPLEALLAGAEGFPPMLDIPPDADDETMVELAIALSLQQDQQG